MNIENKKNFIVLILGLLSLFLLCYFFVPDLFLQFDKPTTYEECISALSNSKKVIIAMDLRNASDSARIPIMQCGVDLASSVALAPKNVSVLVMDNETCLIGTEQEYRPLSDCEELLSSGFAFHIRYGNTTTFYKNKIIIELMNYSIPCKISESKKSAENLVKNS